MTTYQQRSASMEGQDDGRSAPEPQLVDGTLVATEVPKIVSVACQFAKARGRAAAVYLLGAGDPAEDRHDVPITRRTVEQLESALGDRRFDDLDLIIQSSGGDIHAAYQMMSLLRGRMNGGGELTACVSSRAQSAATLLCLGADKILLGELGSLGPLDAQIRKGVTDVGTPNYVSALHLLKGLSRLLEFSLESFNAIAAHLHAHQASRDAQIKYGIEFSHAVSGPLYERIDSESVGYWDQMLHTGEEYGRRLLKRGKLVTNDDVATDRNDHIEAIVHELVYGFPSHELVIDRGVLQDLRLQADLMPDSIWPIARQFAESAAESLIMLVDPHGVPAPGSRDEIALKQWRSIGSDEPTREISWTDKGTTFAIRVALYRPTILPRNPWHEQTPRTADGGPATQYSVPLGYSGG
jgi:hypothetical protein